MSENNGIKTRTVTCPACGGKIEFPVGRNKTMCPFCGNDVVVDEPGWLGALDKFDLKLKDAQTALDNQEWKRARELFEDCSMINETDPRPWKGTVLARTKNLTAGTSDKTEPNFHCYLSRSGLGMNDPFVSDYKAFLERVSDNDAAKSADNAKLNAEYFQRIIDAKKESITEIEGKITEIKNAPTTETAEKKYGGAKARLVFDTVFLVVAPLAVVGLIILAVVLLVNTIQGDPHIFGIIASVLAAVIFSFITKFVWKHYRGTIESFKRRRVAKLQEDHVNDERAKHNNELVDHKTGTISEYQDNIVSLNAAIEEMNKFIAIDRNLRIAYFTKQHLDAAGIENSIVPDEAIVRLSKIEQDYRLYPGYQLVTKIRQQDT